MLEAALAVVEAAGYRLLARPRVHEFVGFVVVNTGCPASTST